jgi:hypothetical protein
LTATDASISAGAFASIWRMRSLVTETCLADLFQRVVGVQADAEVIRSLGRAGAFSSPVASSFETHRFAMLLRMRS